VIGSSQLGLASGLRTFRDLGNEPGFEKRLAIELRPKKRVRNWSSYAASTFLAPFEYNHFGRRVDVVGVRTPTESLARVETIAACAATEASYYYDPDEPSVATRWDDGVSLWDDGVLMWDTFPKLYVRLTGGGDPNSIVVAAELGFFVALRGEQHPDLGDDLLAAAGDFE
jgi:hypothetical protein